MNVPYKKNKAATTRFAPTRFGWMFVIVLACMLMGSINYNNNLGFLFTFLLGSMALVSIIHTYSNIKDIAVETIRSQPIFESQDAVFEVVLQQLSKPHFGLRFQLNESQETVIRSTAKNGDHVSVVVRSPHRGRLSGDKFKVVTEYPFGLFQIARSFSVTATCLVYPKPIPVNQLTTQDLIAAHESQGNRHNAAGDFKGLRTFQNGDALKHIFWKAFSKGQGLLVKEFMQNTSPELCINWEKIGSKDKEKKLSILCAMVLKAHNLKLAYGISLPGQIISPRNGNQHKHACLRALALF
jgi:uncharacterized protein (DUF58 family)